MANLVPTAGALQFKIDNGEMKNGKPVYRSQTINDIDGAKPAEALYAAAEALQSLMEGQVESIQLRRYDLLVL